MRKLWIFSLTYHLDERDYLNFWLSEPRAFGIPGSIIHLEEYLRFVCGSVPRVFQPPGFSSIAQVGLTAWLTPCYTTWESTPSGKSIHLYTYWCQLPLSWFPFHGPICTPWMLFSTHGLTSSLLVALGPYTIPFRSVSPHRVDIVDFYLRFMLIWFIHDYH